MIIKNLLQYIRNQAIHHGKSIVYHAQNLHCHAKRIVRHSHGLVHKHKHHFLAYTHIILLLALFAFYHLGVSIFAEEVAPTTEVAVEALVSEISSETPVEASVAEVSAEVTAVVNEMGDVVVPQNLELSGQNSEIITGENLSAEFLSGGLYPSTSSGGQVTGTGEILTGELLSGEVVIGSGIVLSDTGVVDIVTGNVEIVTGEEQIVLPLSVLYPHKNIEFNASGYVVIDSLESVITTGGEIGQTYCSRIAYENIFRLLKTSFWNDIADTFPKGNADDLIHQGLVSGTLVEVPMTGLVDIFSGLFAVTQASIYDVYADFVVHGKKVSHRIVVLYGDDPDGSRWYVLDPLRGARTAKPQEFFRYLEYYSDETDVHRYLGQGYSPVAVSSEQGLVMSGGVASTTVLELLKSMFPLQSGQVVTGNVERLTGNAEGLTGSELLSGEVVIGSGIVEGLTGNELLSGEIVIGSGVVISETGIVEITTGEIITEEIVIGSGIAEIVSTELVLSSGEVVATGVTIALIEAVSGVQMLDIFETGYFDSPFVLGEVSEKVVALQMLLRSLGYLSGVESAAFDVVTMDAVYQFQLAKNILTPGATISLKGFMGPTTRKVLNEELQQYENQSRGTRETGGKTGTDVILSGDLYPSTGSGQIASSLATTAEAVLVTGQTGLQEAVVGEVAVETGVFTDYEIINLTGYNRSLIFDPLINSGLFTSLLADTGVNGFLSGYQYVTGDVIGLLFDTVQKEKVLEYLASRGYNTDTLTLTPVDYSAVVGDLPIDFSLLSGKLLIPIVLQSMNEMSGQIAEIELPEGTLLKTADGGVFTGDLMPPIFVDTENLDVQTDEEIVSAIDVGSEQGIVFEDSSGNSVNAIFKVPVPEASIGDILSINYSEDGEAWNYLDTVEVVSIDGEPYVIFEASHFTTFYMGTLTGTFVIDNDDVYTTGLNVNLNMDISGANQMRFGNTIAERDSASWVSYASGYVWDLTGTDDIKRVYAQFSGGGLVRNVADSIILDTSSEAQALGLLTWLDSSYISTTIYDIGTFGYNFTASNAGVLGSIRSGEQILSFNGFRYASRSTTPSINSYPFSISARVRPGRVSGVQGLVVRSRSNRTNVFFGIQLNGSNASLIAQNTTAYATNGTSTLSTNRWYHIVGVFQSATARKLYVDGIQEATGTNNVSLNNTNPRWTVGSYGGSTINNYFSGNIDEVRIYNTGLTTAQIQDLYLLSPTFDTQTSFTGTPTLYGELPPKIWDTSLVISGIVYNTTGDGSGKWKTLPMITGLADGTYTVTLNYTNVYGKTGTITYVSGLTIALPRSTGLHINYTPSTYTSGNVVATLTGLDPTYMIVNNYGSEFYTFTGDGSFTYQFVDKQGTTGSITAIVTWIDDTPVTFSGVVNNGYYSGNVTITFTGQDLSGATLSGLYGNAYYSGDFHNNSIVTEEGSYLLTVYDISGKHYAEAIFTIDRVPPTFTGVATGGIYDYSSSGYVIEFADNMSGVTAILITYSMASGNVISSGVYISGTPLIASGHYNYELIVTDAAGNTTGARFHIHYLTFSIEYIPGSGSWTSGDVLVFLTGFSEPVTDFNSTGYVFTGNGSFTFSFYHPEGFDTHYKTVTVDRIDKTMPIFDGVTTGAVYTGDVAITFSDANLSGATLNGNAYISGTVITGDNTYVFLVTDEAGNSTGATFMIDNSAPVFSGVNSGGNYGSVTITFSDPHLSGAVLSGLQGNDYYSGNFQNGTVVNGLLHDEGKYIFTVYDTVGNSTGAIFRISESVLHIYGITSGSYYSGNVTIGFDMDPNPGCFISGAILSGLDGNSYYSGNFQSGSTVTGEGKYSFMLYENDGDRTGAIFTIDKTKPTASVSYDPAIFTGGNVIATLTGFSETGITITNNFGSMNYMFTGNGDFVFEFVDLAGNTGSATATVDRIKRSRLTYSTMIFYENQAINNGGISTIMTLSLGTGAFSGNIISGGYVMINNLPTGLTGAFTLSGTHKLLLSLTGNAANHASGDSVNDVSIYFLTGAFVDMTPDDVIDSSKTGLSIKFYDPNPENGILPSDDTMIDADTNPAGAGNCADGKCQRNNYGATDYLCASDFGSKIILKFDLSGLPTGANITSAKLRLYRYQINGATDATGFTLKKIINNPGWIEGTRDIQEALTGEPNYIQRKWGSENRYNGSPGMVAGLDYATTNLIALGGFTGSNTGSYTQEFLLNAAGVAALQGWVDGMDENQGWVMGDIPSTWLCIRSKEWSTAAEKPLLSINYYVDVTPVTIVSLDPVNNETGFSIHNNLSIHFNKDVFAVSGKNISIKKLSDGSLMETFSATDTSRITIANDYVFINPTDCFEGNMGYYVEIESGAFRDRGYDYFAGIVGSGTWKFYTQDTTGFPLVTGAYFTGIYATTGILGGVVSDIGSGNISERGICRNTTNGFNNCEGTIVSELGNRSVTGDFDLITTGFVPGTMIYFRAFATNAYGTQYSEQNSFITRPSKPILLPATKIDNSRFIINWQVVTGADSYKLYVSIDSGFTSYVTGYAPLTGLTGASFLITDGIEKTTTYYYKLIATNDGGDSESSEYTGTTTTFYPRPVAWLKFEETGGNNAYDSSEGSYHDGILFGDPAKDQVGIDGKTFFYDGINDDVSIVNFNYGSHYTIGFWFKTTSTGNDMHLFSHGADNASNSINVVLDGASQTLKTYIDGNQDIFILDSGYYANLVDGNRHYYTVSVDNDGAVPGRKSVMVYIDGSHELMDSSLSVTASTPINNLVLGRASDTTSLYYQGYLDDFRIFDRVLSENEVSNLFGQFSSNLGSVSLTGPASLDFGTWEISDIPQTIETTLTGATNYFEVNDGVGAYSGYYTTLSMSDFTDSSGDSLSNIYMSIKVMSGVQLLSGMANTGVISAITGVYQTFGTGILTFIQRNVGIGSGILGAYGVLPTFKIIIPELQSPGNYTGTIVFTLYDN